MMMRIYICLFTLIPAAFAADVDWKKLDNELEYLKNNAFVSGQKNEAPAQAEQKLSLRRKPKTLINDPEADPKVAPLEKNYFDKVNFRYSAPKRQKDALKSIDKEDQKLRKSRPEIRINGGIPKLK